MNFKGFVHGDEPFPLIHYIIYNERKSICGKRWLGTYFKSSNEVTCKRCKKHPMYVLESL